MTVFAICMTALSGLLLGILCSKHMASREPKQRHSHSFKRSEITNEEYLNFLNYDGTEQN